MRLLTPGEFWGEPVKGELSLLFQLGAKGTVGLRRMDWGGPADQAPCTTGLVCQLSITLKDEKEDIEEVREGMVEGASFSFRHIWKDVRVYGTISDKDFSEDDIRDTSYY